MGLLKGTIENFVRGANTSDVGLCEYGAELDEEGILSDKAIEISKIMQEIVVYMRMRNEELALKIAEMEAEENGTAE